VIAFSKKDGGTLPGVRINVVLNFINFRRKK